MPLKARKQFEKARKKQEILKTALIYKGVEICSHGNGYTVCDGGDEIYFLTITEAQIYIDGLDESIMCFA